MEIVNQPGREWSAAMTCPRCRTVFRADTEDLRLEGFKTSGAHWNGTAVCADKFFVTCPSDGVDVLLDDQGSVPVLLSDRLQAELDARRRERGY